MARISACIEMLFKEVDLYDRFAAARAAGIAHVEFWSYANKEIPRLRDAAAEAGVSIASFVGSGVSLVEGDYDGAVASLEAALPIAEELEVGTLIVTVGNTIEGRSREEQLENITRGCARLAEIAAAAGRILAVEPLNTLVNHKGYFLDRTATAAEIVDAVGSPALGILHDIYHMQIMEGNVIETIRAHIDRIAHVHVADVPGRHEPGTGELNYDRIIEAIDEAGYEGFVGLEYSPTVETAASLPGWARPGA